MSSDFIPQYPSPHSLKEKAKQRIPKFAFEYLSGGCNEEVNISRNTSDIRQLEFSPVYIKKHVKPALETVLFDKKYSMPFGISPIGLQGLIWPNSAEILAEAAFKKNIPFILSTVSTASIEKISSITEGNFWFQLYHPAEEEITDSLLNRANIAGCKVLVVLCDVPSFGYRNRDIKNGLSMPPSMSISNVMQILSRPAWAMNTLKYGVPTFKNLSEYIPKGFDLSKLGKFMDRTFSGYVDEERLRILRDKWKGYLVLKGVSSNTDVKKCIDLGVDGVIVSNHGGRQVDIGTSAIKSFQGLDDFSNSKIKIMLDSGIESGADIARVIGASADFAFLGKTFMYGVAALGEKGGLHTIEMLERQINQISSQFGVSNLSELNKYLLKND